MAENKFLTPKRSKSSKAEVLNDFLGLETPEGLLAARQARTGAPYDSPQPQVPTPQAPNKRKRLDESPMSLASTPRSKRFQSTPPVWEIRARLAALRRDLSMSRMVRTHTEIPLTQEDLQTDPGDEWLMLVPVSFMPNQPSTATSSTTALTGPSTPTGAGTGARRKRMSSLRSLKRNLKKNRSGSAASEQVSS